MQKILVATVLCLCCVGCKDNKSYHGDLAALPGTPPQFDLAFWPPDIVPHPHPPQPEPKDPAPMA